MANPLQNDERKLQQDAWVDLVTQRKRLADEWAEMKAYIAKQEASIAARTADIHQREKAIRGLKSRLETDAKDLKQEVSGLEARAAHTRSIVEELDRKREELRNEILAITASNEPETINGSYRIPLDRRADKDLTQWAAELDAQDRRILEEKAALSKLKAALDRESVSLADERKVVAEQFALLGAARAEWQETEGRTVVELEDLAKSLRQREDDLALREQRLANAESRRQMDHGELNQLRARLEAWQAKLIAVSRLWHAERECREGELEKRSKVLSLREKIVKAAFERWDHVPAADRDQLKLKLWSPDQSDATTGEVPGELNALREEFLLAARELSQMGGVPDDHLPLADEEVSEEDAGPEPVMLPFAFQRAAA